ncbi:uncharacterized protein KY384_008816 [Bacidia gigantensis]|uniref:uncharacterized protein n=1 Tax=Bacidia gigantensis TaxID=2732470 RepID=UPI001D055059|nr:uncharacterized protein KY384_008816 [Bacidia gigantensis]KAG8526615.1 hypothetical protein KY384_008816 [Bacidia gigantensis]
MGECTDPGASPSGWLHLCSDEPLIFDDEELQPHSDLFAEDFDPTSHVELHDIQDESLKSTLREGDSADLPFFNAYDFAAQDATRGLHNVASASNPPSCSSLPSLVAPEDLSSYHPMPDDFAASIEASTRQLSFDTCYEIRSLESHPSLPRHQQMTQVEAECIMVDDLEEGDEDEPLAISLSQLKCPTCAKTFTEKHRYK